MLEAYIGTRQQSHRSNCRIAELLGWITKSFRDQANGLPTVEIVLFDSGIACRESSMLSGEAESCVEHCRVCRSVCEPFPSGVHGEGVLNEQRAIYAMVSQLADGYWARDRWLDREGEMTYNNLPAGEYRANLRLGILRMDPHAPWRAKEWFGLRLAQLPGSIFLGLLAPGGEAWTRPDPRPVVWAELPY